MGLEYPQVEYFIDGVRFILTSVACPEQYSAYIDETEVGYLRLRNGIFRIDFPTHRSLGGNTIHEQHVEADECFNNAERAASLKLAAKLLNEHWDGVRPNGK